MSESSSPLQEIICCMGLPTSGNPSQFVLERAAAAAKLDIRCLTVDVKVARLEDAVRGASAMGFRAMVLADALAREAFRFVTTSQRGLQALGAVDIIYHEDDQLAGAHSLVLAMSEWLAELPQLPETALLFGRGVSARAATCALASSECPRVLLASNPDAKSDWESLGLTAQDGATQVEPITIGSTAELQQRSQECLVIDATESSNAHLRRVNPIDLADSAVFMDLGFDPPTTTAASHALNCGVKIVDGLEMLARRYDAAFRVITRTKPDRTLIRESIEEFFLI